MIKLLCLTIIFSGSINMHAQVEFEPEGTLVPVNSGNVDNTFYWNKYGVRFLVYDPSTMSTPVPAVYADIGGTQTAFNLFINQNNPFCNITPSSNWMNDNPNQSPVDHGCWFLTDDGVLGTPLTLRIDYDYPKVQTNYVSGYIMDMDGGEGWEIHIYTNNDLTTPETSIQILSANWHGFPNYLGCGSCATCTICTDPQCDYDPTKVLDPVATTLCGNTVYYSSGTGDATAKFWEYTAKDPINRVEIEYLGDPGGTGVAFDGLGGVDTCSAHADFTYVQDTDNSAQWNFSDASTSGTSTIISKEWVIEGHSYFGDDVSHVFSASGTYSVCLTVTAISNQGMVCCTDTFCEDITVTVPVTDCLMKPEIGIQCFDGSDCIFQFNGDPGLSTRGVKHWFWDFGDGTTSTEKDPIHAYSGMNEYEVCLTVIGLDGGNCCIGKVCTTLVTGECKGISPGPCEAAESQGMIKTEGVESPTEEELFESDVTGKAESVLPANKVTIIPNPSREKATVEFYLATSVSRLNISVFNLSGKRVMEVANVRQVSVGMQSVELNTSELSAGTYLLRIETDAGLSTSKIVVLE